MTSRDYIFSAVVVLLNLLLFLLFSSTDYSYAQLCEKWSAGEKVGVLDHNLINEASGIAVSKEFPTRLYHVNDSGGGPYFYITTIGGKNTQKIKIEGAENIESDFEDLGIGKCLDNKSCLFIADIGDNQEKRKSVKIFIIAEKETYGEAVKPDQTLILKYADRPHNAEGMALHPNGDIYIITKEENLKNLKAYPVHIFRIEKDLWQNSLNGVLKLSPVGEIDIPGIAHENTVFGQIVSAFDISSDGTKFIILTFENAIEFNVDLSKSQIKPTSELKDGVDYRIIELSVLPQQESVSYLPYEKGFLYNTEYHGFEVPILRVDCLDGKSHR